MTQEVRVMMQLTLECDVWLSEAEITERVMSAIRFNESTGIDIILTDIIEIRGEAEIYGTE